MKPIGFILLILLALTSCNEAKNTNKIFTAFNANSKEYKQELAKQIAAHGDDLTYTFNKCLNIDGKSYLDITFSGSNINAKGLVLVNNWNKLENLKRTNGMGYRGAELNDLKLDIVNSDSDPIFIYKDLDMIID